MKEDFSEPQKQSAAGIVIMFANALQKVIRAIALPLILIVIKSGNSGQLTLKIIAGGGLLTLLLAVFAYIRFQKFSFFLDEQKQEFVINEGVFNRSTLTIQLSKIQQVNINQSLLQQIIGVYSLDIDTAGSEKKEASIKAIDHLTALKLKEKLLSKVKEVETIAPGETRADHEQLVLKLSVSTLFKIGITTNYGASLVLIGGFFLGLIQLFKDYTSAFKIQSNQVDQLLDSSLNLFSVCFLIVFALLIILGTNIIRIMIRYFSFRIVKQKGSLAISSGLFTRQNTLVKPDKVQVSAYSQNYFQKKFHLSNIKIKQATYDAADKEEQKKTAIEIPGCDHTERDEVLKMIYRQIPATGQALKPDYRFMVLQVMRWIVIPVLIFLGTGLSIHPPFRPYFTLALPYIIIVAVMLYFEFKRHRLYVNENFIIKRSGIWDVTYEIIEPHKIQAITTKQYLWHKKTGVGHLSLHTAAGTIRFKYGNYSMINRMVNFWMYQVERSKKDWS